MKSKVFSRTACTMAVLALAVISIGAQAQSQNSNPTAFSGVINAYSPQTTSTGPYEVRGPWSLTLTDDATKADFSAALDMELSDGWVLTKNNGNFDPNARGAHTHHVTLVGAEVVRTATGLRVSGMATITLNGSPAPVSPSPMTIQITGGTDVPFSNITLTFTPPGSNHFGTEPLPGVIQSVQ